MSLLQTGNGATLSEMLNDQDGEAATSALNEWKNHLDGDRRERAQSHRSLEKELAFKAGAQQALSNAAASGEHLKAAHLALKLGHPFALRKAVEAMIADPEGQIGRAHV